MTPREIALSRRSESQKWVGAAIGALNQVIGFNGKRDELDRLPQFQAMKTHFHVSLGPPPSVLDRFIRLLPFTGDDPTLTLLTDVRSKYFSIQGTLVRESIFLDHPAEGEGEKATAFVPRIRDGTIRITPNYAKVGELNQALVLVHEAAHFIGDEFQDWAYRDRTGEDDPSKYINLLTQFAVRNPDSYAYFALQMAKKIDRVLDLKE